MSTATETLVDLETPTPAFEEWVSVMFERLTSMLHAQHAQVSALSKRVRELERSAGRSFVHPSDLIEEANACVSRS